MSHPQTDFRTAAPLRHSFFAIVFSAGVFAIFIIIYLISRQPTRPLSAAAGAPDDAAWRYSSEGRSSKLAELRAKEHEAATTYGWVDQEKGTVRLPLDRAMELTVQEINAPQASKRR